MSFEEFGPERGFASRRNDGEYLLKNYWVSVAIELINKKGWQNTQELTGFNVAINCDEWREGRETQISYFDILLK